MSPTTAPIETYLRRPRVLVLQEDDYASRIVAALRGAPLAVRTVPDIAQARLALRRSYVTVVVCDLASAHDLLGLRFRSGKSPAFLITSEIGKGAPLPKGPSVRNCTAPIDPRRVVGDVLALAHGWQNADTQPVGLNERLSVIPNCGLVFCDDGIVPLLRMERLVFALLSREPGRLVTWTRLAQATGASQKLLYVSADRLRRKLEEFIPGHRYIETQPGRGLALDLTGA